MPRASAGRPPSNATAAVSSRFIAPHPILGTTCFASDRQPRISRRTRTRDSQQRGDEFFLKPDAAIVPSLQATSQWAAGQGYDPAAVNTFLQVADYYLVAHAHAHRHVVVTHEVVAHTTKKIKIPNACIGMGVKCMTPYEMLRVERARFVLGPSS